MGNPTTEVTRRLAGWVDELRFADLPADAVEMAKSTVLDFLGCALQGSQRPHAIAATALQMDLGGAEQATILGTRRRTSVDRAAFLNGTFGSSTPQFDDVSKEALGHPGVGTHPAVLAVGEHQHASGRDALVAVVAGYELAWRIGAGVGLDAFNRGWHPRGGFNVFAAAVAAAKLLGLQGENTYCNVLGLAGNQAAGLMSACFWHDAWYLLSGHASQNGVLAALLAEAGYGAGCTVIEDDYGGYGHVVADEPDFERMLEGLGQQFQVTLTGQKPHSSSATTHASIDAVLSLREGDGVDPDLVDTIEVRTYQVAAETMGRTHPRTHLHATMSIPYLVSRALLDGQIQLEQFTPEKLDGPEVNALQDRVRMVVDPELDRLAPHHLAATVIVNTRDGGSTSRTVTVPRGDPENPMPLSEIEAKYRRLASGILETDAIEETVQVVRHLDDLDDVADLAAVLRRVVDNDR